MGMGEVCAGWLARVVMARARSVGHVSCLAEVTATRVVFSEYGALSFLFSSFFRRRCFVSCFCRSMYIPHV